ncbi:MarR family transcriptional regulator [Actinomadura sp. KC06]|uniref:MarR family winged helix-turn-helix transcriptional regulator n=1 Tax=Actinomadura sp. KC06 TaxID=2530369 RepID=UPI00104BE3CB|nr:MarR family winged helix-turn-helix transcriptional regulator [Actinomadura sp. KC06]TDD31924.1 MarR family transcriptional regulator [Actinomadura sp. KC06]
MSAVPAPAPARDRDRRTEVRRLIDSMEHAKVISDGHFSALGMLITDASLSADEPALVECQDGLQWLHRHYLDVNALDGPQREQRGRILGLIDVVHWALKRLPSGLQLALQPDGHAARFLLAVYRRQGLSNKELAAELRTDETEISRVGRRLLSAGVVWRRKEWRHNAWDLTPRGRQYLETSGLLTGELAEDEPSGRAARRAGPARSSAEPEPRSPDAVPQRQDVGLPDLNHPSPSPEPPPRSAPG